jgi:propanediol dehydratase large subunit
VTSRTETTITATFKDGHTATRRTRAAYFWAVKRNVGTQAGRGPTITFHRTEEQARGIAGKRGEVVRTDHGVEAR